MNNTYMFRLIILLVCIISFYNSNAMASEVDNQQPVMDNSEVHTNRQLGINSILKKIQEDIFKKDQECSDIEGQINRADLIKGFAGLVSGWNLNFQNYNSNTQNLYTMLSTCRNEKSMLELKQSLLQLQILQQQNNSSFTNARSEFNSSEYNVLPGLTSTQITIHRIDQNTGSVRRNEIHIDDQLVGRLYTGQTLTFPISPGKHTIYTKMDWSKSPILNIDIKSGESLALKCFFSGFWGKPQLVRE